MISSNLNDDEVLKCLIFYGISTVDIIADIDELWKNDLLIF